MKNTKHVRQLFYLTAMLICSSSFAQTEFWGVTENAIFKTDGNGDSIKLVTSANNSNGTSLTKGLDGKLYGITNSGGASSKGYIYQYDPSENKINIKYSFSTPDGYGTNSTGMLMSADTVLYGCTFLGGTNNNGSIFSFDLKTDSFKIIYAPTSSSSRYHTPMQASNGHIYGTCMTGGDATAGFIWEYDAVDNKFSIPRELSVTNGKFPNGGLVQASNGKLYGLTTEGGANNRGVIFSLDITNKAFAVVHTFTANGPGTNPYGTMVEVSPNLLYGIALGGNDLAGAVFSFKADSNIYTKRYDLISNVTGYSPRSTLLKASNGKLYFATTTGAANNYGALIEFDYTTNTGTKKFDMPKNLGRPAEQLLVEACALPAPFATSLPDTSFICEVDFTDTLRASSCYGLIDATSNVTFPLTTLGPNTVTWTYDDGHGNYTKQSHVITILPPDTAVEIVNGKFLLKQGNATYQWHDCDNNNAEVVGATEQSFTAPDSGNYKARITYGSCVVFSDCISLKVAGIKTITNPQLNIYPNPAATQVTLKSSSLIKNCTLVNMVGSTVNQYEVNANQFTIKIAEIPRGIYYIKAEVGNQAVVYRFVKE